jgi:hypothetical protein
MYGVETLDSVASVTVTIPVTNGVSCILVRSQRFLDVPMPCSTMACVQHRSISSDSVLILHRFISHLTDIYASIPTPSGNWVVAEQNAISLMQKESTHGRYDALTAPALDS